MNLMKSIITNIEAFILNNDLWLHLSIIMGSAFIFMQTSQEETPSNYLIWVGTFSVLFASVLIFSFYRRRLLEKTKSIYYWTIWVFAGILFPLIFQLLASQTSLLHGVDKQLNYFLIKNLDIIFAVLLPTFTGIEIILFISRNKGPLIPFLAKLKPSLSVLFAYIILIALMTISLDVVQTKLSMLSTMKSIVFFFSCYLQFFLIYIVYFSFYYINHHLLYNKILKLRGPLSYLLSILALLLFLTPIINLYVNQFPVIHTIGLHTMAHAESIYDTMHYAIPAIILVLTFPLIIFIELNKKAKMVSELQKEKSDAVLSMLKQQINPHFFFNTLNNLYALSLDQSKETPATILKLSELMRFVIYKGEQDEVLLTEEIKYIEDYIDLQKIRHHKKLDINFEIIGETTDIKVPPLLLIILVENAFKHGIEPAENESFIDIKLSVSSQKIVFECQNSMEKDQLPIQKKGIGIPNLKKRLNIQYPNKHTFIIIEKANKFIATLSLDL